MYTEIVTYDMSNAARPQRLARLTLAEGERLFATRFVGDRAYIVTFEQIDPLWILDLSDPANPVILGELEIPGWSTYIEPIGEDRLITMGIDNVDGWRAAVQLFDVSDPSAPALLSKAPLGENYSWSEANSDEKAFRVLRDEGMILVPFSIWAGVGSTRGVQILDFDEEALTPRGVIEHDVVPRRATARDGLIYSISNAEALTVDASDRDAPELAHRLELARSVDEVWPIGGFLVEADQGWETNEVTLRVSSSEAPEVALSTWTLGEERSLAGVSVDGDRLSVLTLPKDSWRWNVDPKNEQFIDAPYLAELVVFDGSAFPEWSVIGVSSEAIEPYNWDVRLTPKWLGSDVVTWTSESQGWYHPFARIAIDIIEPFWYAPSTPRFLTYTLSDDGAPTFASDFSLSSDEESHDFFQGSIIAEGTRVYMTRSHSEWIDDEEKPEDPEEAVLPPNFRRRGIWVTQYFLEVVDFADPFEPTERLPVSVPGSLVGALYDGSVVLTDGVHYDENGKTDGVRWLDASAYDGVSAFLLESWELSETFGSPQPVDGGVAVGVWDREAEEREIIALGVDTQGAFTELSSTEVGESAWEFLVIDGVLRYRSAQGRGVTLVGYDSPANPVPMGSFGTPGCLWVDLARVAVDDSGTVWLPFNNYGLQRGVPIAEVD